MIICNKIPKNQVGCIERGEINTSPLFDRVMVGENPKTHLRCITIESIKIGFDRSNFFGVFSKTSIKEDGTFYKGNNNDIYDKIFPFLEGTIKHIRDSLRDEWDKGESEDGFLAINAGIESIIRIISDIIDHLINLNKVKAKTDSTEFLVKEVCYYLDPLIDYFKSLNRDNKLKLKKSYGTAGKVRYWRTLQLEINKARKDFNPNGLEKYWKDEDKRYNEESFKMIRDLEIFMKDDFRNQLNEKIGAQWFKQGLPKKVYDSSITRAADKNYEAKSANEEVEPWDCLNIIDYRSIAVYGRNWSEIFEENYTKPGEEKIRDGKNEKTKWMQKLERIRNENFHSYSVKDAEYFFLIELHDWLIKNKLESDL